MCYSNPRPTLSAIFLRKGWDANEVQVYKIYENC
jgi:hypothetical protein